jgi:lipopolysaccharide export system protein LptA
MVPRVVQGQDKERCNFPNYPQTTQTLQKTPAGQYNTFFGHGVDVRCPTKDLTLRADSLEYYADEGRIYFIGNVRYDEPRLALTSDYLTYFQKDERIIANGTVNARLPSGSTLKGPFAEYFRAIPGTRPNARIVATGRPAITIVQKDSGGRPAEPVTVVGNNITMEGDSLVYAGGSVLVTRQEVIARGDSMALDSQREITVMMRSPSIEGRRDRPFTLSGERIELMSRNRKLQRVLSKGKATAVSEDMTLASDTIDLRISGDLLQRAIAWGPSRAKANSPAQRIVSDSIDVSMPNQRIREMHAVRTALAEGRPDTSRFRPDTLDWMRGDTIVARFDTVPTRDTSRAARMKEIVAVGNAKSYYHVAPGDSTADKFAINYVIGRLITVAFQDQKVSKVTVIDKAAGVYLEPKPRTASADTARAARPAVTPAVRPTTSPPPLPPTTSPPLPARTRPPR